jgi:hypothetical protein
MRWARWWLRWVAATAVLIGQGPGLVAPVLAADPPLAGLRGAMVGTSLVHDLSRPLREMPPLPPKPRRAERQEMRRRRPAVPRPAVPDLAAQGGFGPPSRRMPASAKSFDGMDNIEGFLPPDTNGDVGPNHYVELVNTQIEVFDKRSGASLFGPMPLDVLWSGMPQTVCNSDSDGDPIVLYDSIADRWLVSQFAASGPFGECIAISKTPDPAGAYFRYFFQFSATDLYDYPHLGVWPDGYYMTANRFQGNTFLGPAALVFDRARMLAGQAADVQEFDLSPDLDTVTPADLDGPRLPPAGEPAYFAEVDGFSSAINLWRFHVDWANGSNSTLSGPIALGVAAFNSLCLGTLHCVPQPGTPPPPKLDGLGDPLMHRVAYRNFGDHESLVANHAADVSTTAAVHAGVRWYEIRSTPPGAPPVIHQQGTYAPDASHRWMASIAMDRDGDIALGYSVSSRSVFPSIRYTGRLAADPLGVLPQGESTLVEGRGSQLDRSGRWGDYSMMAVDPVDDCTFWYTNEYLPATSQGSWHTRIGSFKFPTCGTARSVPDAAGRIPVVLLACMTLLGVGRTASRRRHRRTRGPSARGTG